MTANRTKLRLLSLTCALAATLALSLAAGPAQAARRTVLDAHGDAPARLDITRFTVRNTSVPHPSGSMRSSRTHCGDSASEPVASATVAASRTA